MKETKLGEKKKTPRRVNSSPPAEGPEIADRLSHDRRHFGHPLFAAPASAVGRDVAVKHRAIIQQCRTIVPVLLSSVFAGITKEKKQKRSTEWRKKKHTHALERAYAEQAQWP